MKPFFLMATTNIVSTIDSIGSATSNGLERFMKLDNNYYVSEVTVAIQAIPCIPVGI